VPLMNRHESRRGKLEGILAKYLVNTLVNLIGLLDILLGNSARAPLLVIAVDAPTSIEGVDLALDVLFGRIDKILGHLEPIHRLQADGGLPYLGFASTVGLAFADVGLQLEGPGLHVGHGGSPFLRRPDMKKAPP